MFASKTSKLIATTASSVLRRAAVPRVWYNTTAVVAAQQLQAMASSSSSSSSTSSTWLLNSLSFAAPEESEQAYVQSMLPREYQHYLAHHTINDFSHGPIRTLQDVLVSNQACIVTTITKPHTIIAVNDAWTALCGYTQDEVHHQSISSVLHGPLTNDAVIQSTMNRVQANVIDAPESSSSNTTEDMYVVNYKKDRTSFINHVTMSKIVLSPDQPQVQFLLGVVQPTESAPLRMVL